MKQFLLIAIVIVVMVAWVLRDRWMPDSRKGLETPLGQVVAGNLVDYAGYQLDDSALVENSFVLVYFSAHWCPPCRQFTPKLVNLYNARKQGANFEILFVSSDRSEADMYTYMRETAMPWPAVRYGSAAAEALRGGLAGPGIPCLVMLDREGNVVSDSYKGRSYRGPQAVLDDLVKALAKPTTASANATPVTPE